MLSLEVSLDHVALLGDSIFDNGGFVAPAPVVSEQLRDRLGSDWAVSLVAVDGHVTSDVQEGQIRRVSHSDAAGGEASPARNRLMEQ